MIDVQRDLAACVEDFVADIAQLARKTAMDTLAVALQGGRAGAPGGTTLRATAGVGAAPQRRAPRRAKGAKRDPGELAKVVEVVHAYVKANAGQRIEQIKAALGYKTSELALPVRKLIASRAIRSEGKKRSMKYFPGDGAPPAAKRRKRAKARKARKKK